MTAKWYIIDISHAIEVLAMQSYIANLYDLRMNPRLLYWGKDPRVTHGEKWFWDEISNTVWALLMKVHVTILSD